MRFISFFSILSLFLLSFTSFASLKGNDHNPLNNKPSQECMAALTFHIAYEPRISAVAGPSTFTRTVSFPVKPEKIYSNLPEQERFGIEKAILLVNFGNALKQALHQYENKIEPHPSMLAASQPQVPTETAKQFNGIPVIPAPAVKSTTAQADTTTREERIAYALKNTVKQFEEVINSRLPNLREDPKVREAIDLAYTLANTISKKEPYDAFCGTQFQPGYRGAPRGGFMGAGGLEGMKSFSAPQALSAHSSPSRLSTGGNQDWDHVKQTIRNCQIPKEAALDLGGFLRSFHIPFVANAKASGAIDAFASVMIDPVSRKLYAQIDFGSDIDYQTYVRPPLNLAIAIDVSGSMGADDGTRQSRLDWAKDSVREMLNNLTARDQISVVFFDHQIQGNISAQYLGSATDEVKEQIKSALTTANPSGGTDLALGLTRASNHVRAQKLLQLTAALEAAVDHAGTEQAHIQNVAQAGASFIKSFENRVIILTDAGNNTGSSDSQVKTLVQEMAGSGINTTVIGIGDKLNTQLAQTLAETKGASSIFVQDGEKLFELFKRFKFLVSPVAYDVNVLAQLTGIDAALVKAHGINAPANSIGLLQLMTVPTMFLVGGSENGGGTILLEYDLK